MPDDLTQRQEHFCLEYLETGSAVEAYRRAYDKDPSARDGWLYVEASQMLDHPKISLRIKSLQEQAARLSVFTVHKAFEEYEEARALALLEKNPSAAVSAVTGKVKLFGLDQPVKHEHTGRDGRPIEHSVGPNEAFAHFVGLLGRDVAASAGGIDGASDVEGEGPPRSADA